MEAHHGEDEDTSRTVLGTYALRDAISDLPLSSASPDTEAGDDNNDEQAYITCVDAWEGNVYIGTSTGQVLHYVALPADTSTSSPTYIFASKLEPPYTTKQTGRDAGVKQILVLPDAGKACILCNGTLTFYTLPELSPAYSEKIKQVGCTWIGGLDANQNREEADSTVVVICLRQRVRLIRIGRLATKIRDIELPGVSAIQRRDNLACVADGTTYSLLDVVNHRKNELFPISSLSAVEDEPPPPPVPRHAQSRSVSAVSPSPQTRGHDRNTSLGGEPRDNALLRPDSSSPWPSRTSSRPAQSPADPSSREGSPAKSDVASPRASMDAAPRADTTVARPLPPNIVTPTPTEFLLTTGTEMTDPGIGMFVNLEGDPSRGPLEFSSYPESLVLDGTGQGDVLEQSDSSSSKGYVLAIVQRKAADETRKAIEIQRWDVEPGEQQRSKEWLMLGPTKYDEAMQSPYGLKIATSATELAVPEVSHSLRLRRLQLSATPSEADVARDAEEDSFAARFAQTQATILLHSHDKVQWITKSPLILQLDSRLAVAVQRGAEGELTINTSEVQSVINDLRGQEARDELEFCTITYIRQKASLLLFGHLISQTVSGATAYESGKRLAEEALIAGELDPRIVLSLVPPLQQDIDEGEGGIWISQGLRDTITMLRESFDVDSLAQDPRGLYGSNLLSILKRYLLSWRNKKGFGSVSDETYVFRTVDAALLYILLLLDQSSPRGPAVPGTIRAELNDVVDRGVDCFDRAVQLLEQFGRLYMLSRLYQKHKMVAEVLGTWKRILEGEKDAGGELIEGEQVLRRYLTKIRDQGLVQEYGLWLANRNPQLGVQVFADDMSRVKFDPAAAVALLKEEAPLAVKYYLEHLVFGKHQAQYTNDLLAFYLDTILAELAASPAATQSLMDSYAAYRYLRPPKPTYSDFLSDATSAEWQRNRLRLLQLLSGPAPYDVPALRARLAPHAEALVPESIILLSREGAHTPALRLLVRSLGDYDTAIRYCLLGGASTFHPHHHPTIPSKDEQAALFATLLEEFFGLDDESERIERTAELLERFGGWFDVGEVVDMLPAEWSVSLVGEFLAAGVRRLVGERREGEVVRGLVGAGSLRWEAEVVERRKELGPVLVGLEGGEGMV